MTQFNCLDVMQGKNDQRTELYIPYNEGVAQFLTQQDNKSNDRVVGFAGEQVIAAGGLL